MIVYLVQDIPAFVMHCVNGESGSSLLIRVYRLYDIFLVYILLIFLLRFFLCFFKLILVYIFLIYMLGAKYEFVCNPWIAVYKPWIRTLCRQSMDCALLAYMYVSNVNFIILFLFL